VRVVPSEDQFLQARSEIDHRTAGIVDALSKLDEHKSAAASRRPGWSRLTIACHLRYGAEAIGAMTEATLSGRPASYYQVGRAQPSERRCRITGRDQREAQPRVVLLR